MHKKTIASFATGLGVELALYFGQPLFGLPCWANVAGFSAGAVLIAYGAIPALGGVLIHHAPPSWFVIPALRDRVQWAQYAPDITSMNGDIGMRFELAADGQTVNQARTYAGFKLRNRSPFGRALVSFVDCRMEVKPRTGRVRDWHSLPVGPSHRNIEVTIPLGEVRNQALEFVSLWEGGDVAQNPRLDFDFEWKITGITGRLIDGSLTGKVQIFRGRHLGKVER